MHTAKAYATVSRARDLSCSLFMNEINDFKHIERRQRRGERGNVRHFLHLLSSRRAKLIYQ